MKPLDADVIMARATPLTHQQAHEIQQVWFVAEHVVDAPLARA